MQNGIHFISGLPRAGSTLLAALLRQNPRVRAAMTSPVGSIVTQLMRTMSQENESAVFIDDDQRSRILRAAVDAYYADIHSDKVVFDTNRLWCSKLATIAALWPQAKIIACVRNPAWVLDSIERLTRKNALEPSGIFKFDPTGTVYSRAEGLMSGTGGMIGYSLNALREAVFDSHHDRMLLVRFETLIADPAKVMATIYDFVGLSNFVHDFTQIEPDYDAMLFDARIGSPGLHAVGSRVHSPPRTTVLPPDLFDTHIKKAFWDQPDGLPKTVRLV
jgi:sulfotransferase